MDIDPSLREACPSCKKMNSVFAYECGQEEDDERDGAKGCTRSLIRTSPLPTFVSLLAIFACGALFRATGALLPAYAAVAIGIVHLYAIAFSRGAALSSAAFWLGGVAAGWGAWALATGQLTGSSNRGVVAERLASDHASSRAALLAIAMAIVGVLSGIRLGRRVIRPGIRHEVGSYFLAAGSFVFGLWGVWIALIQARWATQGVYDVTIGAALAVPMALLVLAKPPARRRKLGATPVPLWLGVAALYVFLWRPLARAYGYVLGVLIPHLVGWPELPVERPARWSATVSDRAPWAAAVLLVAALIILLASSLTRTLNGLRWPTPMFYTRQLERLRERRRRAPKGLAGSGARLSVSIERLAVRVTLLAYRVGAVAALAGKRFIADAVTMLREAGATIVNAARFIVAPFAAFSLLALAALLLLRRLQAHLAQGDDSVRALWGQTATFGVLIVLLCAAALGLSPTVRSRYIGLATELTAVVGIFAYGAAFGASLGFFALVWLIDRALPNRPAPSWLQPGTLFWFSLISTAACVALLVLVGARLPTVGTLVMLALVAVIGAVLGARPFEHDLVQALHRPLPVVAAAAAPSSRPSAPSLVIVGGEASLGAKVTVAGAGFAPGAVTLAWDVGANAMTTAAVSPSGGFQVNARLPKAAPAGRHAIVAYQHGVEMARLAVMIAP